MKKLFIAIAAVAMMAATSASAQTMDCKQLDITSMNQTELEHAKALCQSQAPATVAKEVTPEKVKQWAELGQEFSMAIVSTAKGLGQTANEFLFTPVGIMIAFYFLWGKIGGIIVGVPLLVASWAFYYAICRRVTTQVVEYVQTPVLWGAFTRRVVSKVDYDQTDGVQWTWAWLAFPLLIIDALILGCLIF